MTYCLNGKREFQARTSNRPWGFYATLSFFKVQFSSYLALANYSNSPKHYYMLCKGIYKWFVKNEALRFGRQQAMVTVICLLWDFRQVSKSLWNLTFSSQYQNNNIFAFEKNQWNIACQKNSHRTWHIVSSQNNLFNLHLSMNLIRTYMIIKAWMFFFSL